MAESSIKHLQSVINVLRLADEETLKKSEFLEHAKSVVESLNKRELSMTKLVRDALEEFRSKNNENFSTLESKAVKRLEDSLNNLESRFSGLEEVQRQTLNFVRDKARALKDGEPGADADPEEVAQLVLERLQVPESPTVEQITEALQLKPEDIDGLDKFVRERIPQRSLGGGNRVTDYGVQFAMGRIIKSETPSGDIDGANTEYTTTQPIHTVISFIINGQAISDDEYTIAGNTITMDEAIPSDLSGTSFRVTYV